MVTASKHILVGGKKDIKEDIISLKDACIFN